jgi:hypothetical protein
VTTPAPVAFPNNVVEAIEAEIKDLIAAETTEIDTVVKRPLRTTDPHKSVGIYAEDWLPQDFNIGLAGPAIAQYLFSIMVMCKNTNEEEGLAEHADLSKKVRSMLYRSQSLQVRLAQLQETSSGVLERAARWGVRRQRFMSGEISGQFIYLSVIEFWLETEAV